MSRPVGRRSPQSSIRLPIWAWVAISHAREVPHDASSIAEAGPVSVPLVTGEAPIRAELRNEYAAALALDLYDVREDPAADRHFGIRAIPTLIFYDATEEELARREGYMPKADILATMDQLGLHVEPVPAGAERSGP